MTIPEAFQIAVQHHQAGRLAEAEGIYRQILELAPNHTDALHLLGVIAHQVGQNDAAVELIGKAIALVPNVPEFHSNIGEAYRAMNRNEEAITAYRRAIQLNPDYADAHYNLGNALTDREKFDDAIAAYRRAIRLKPDYPMAYNNLGVAFWKQGGVEEAILAYRSAIQLNPDFADPHSNLGNALIALGNHEEAIAECRRAIQLKPDYAEAHGNLSNALKEQGRMDEAMAECRMAIELKPDFPEARYNMGNVLRDQCHLDEAIGTYRRALELKPDFVDAHNNLGNVLKEQGRLDEAIGTYRRALGFKPAYVSAHSNLLFDMHYVSGTDVSALYGEHRRWDEAHAEPLRKLIPPHGNDRDPERRLRIGYVSPDFREHSVAYFMESLLASHDHSQVEVYCYADLVREDGTSRRLQCHARQWRPIAGKTDGQVAELIRKDGIDILVDLAGHTAGNRLLVFARKPAPVQVTYLGYPDTTGMKAMDYRLTDGYADPPGTSEHLHSEELMRLPGSAWCYRPSGEAPPVGSAPVLSGGGVTFGCFNPRPKMTEEVLALWARLLMAVPGSRLLLKNLGFRDSSVRERVMGMLMKGGVGEERVEFMGRVPSVTEHLVTYGRVDIALDTYPYHGTTTTCEALWMGVPVIALAGRTHASRVGVSLLTNAGLPELIAGSAEQYVEIAVKLAADIPRLVELRASLRERMASSALMDAPRFARNVEQAYRQMWRAWCAKQCSSPPA